MSSPPPNDHDQPSSTPSSNTPDPPQPNTAGPPFPMSFFFPIGLNGPVESTSDDNAAGEPGSRLRDTEVSPGIVWTFQPTSEGETRPTVSLGEGSVPPPHAPQSEPSNDGETPSTINGTTNTGIPPRPQPRGPFLPSIFVVRPQGLQPHATPNNHFNLPPLIPRPNVQASSDPSQTQGQGQPQPQTWVGNPPPFFQFIFSGPPERGPNPEKAAELLRSIPSVGKGMMKRVNRVYAAEEAGGAVAFAEAGDDEELGWKCGICLEGCQGEGSRSAVHSEIKVDTETTSEPEQKVNKGSESNSEDVKMNVEAEKEKGTGVKALPCNHLFHDTCLEPWFQTKTTCPTCRLDLDPLRTLHNPPHPRQNPLRPTSTPPRANTPPYARPPTSLPFPPSRLSNTPSGVVRDISTHMSQTFTVPLPSGLSSGGERERSSAPSPSPQPDLPRTPQRDTQAAQTPEMPGTLIFNFPINASPLPMPVSPNPGRAAYQMERALGIPIPSQPGHLDPGHGSSSTPSPTGTVDGASREATLGPDGLPRRIPERRAHYSTTPVAGPNAVSTQPEAQAGEGASEVVFEFAIFDRDHRPPGDNGSTILENDQNRGGGEMEMMARTSEMIRNVVDQLIADSVGMPHSEAGGQVGGQEDQAGELLTGLAGNGSGGQSGADTQPTAADLFASNNQGDTPLSSADVRPQDLTANPGDRPNTEPTGEISNSPSQAGSQPGHGPHHHHHVVHVFHGPHAPPHHHHLHHHHHHLPGRAPPGIDTLNGPNGPNDPNPLGALPSVGLGPNIGLPGFTPAQNSGVFSPFPMFPWFDPSADLQGPTPPPTQPEQVKRQPVPTQSLSSWVSEREKGLGWRCDAPICILAPSTDEDDDTDTFEYADTTDKAGKEMIPIYSTQQPLFKASSSDGQEGKNFVLLSCPHRYHRSCLENAERIRGASNISEEREWVRCEVCRKDGWVMPRSRTVRQEEGSAGDEKEVEGMVVDV